MTRFLESIPTGKRVALAVLACLTIMVLISYATARSADDRPIVAFADDAHQHRDVHVEHDFDFNHDFEFDFEHDFDHSVNVQVDVDRANREIHIYTNDNERGHRLHTLFNSRQAYEEEVMIEATYPLAPGGNLNVAVGDADVVVKEYNGDDAEITVSIRSRDMEKAREYFEAQNFTVDGNSREITVKTDPTRRNWNWRINGGVQITVTALVPSETHMNVRTSDGDIQMESFTGDADVKTSDGDVYVDGLTGNSVSVRTSDGDVKAGILKAEELNVSTSDGDIVLTEVLATTTLKVRTSDGDIHVKYLEGDSHVTTSDGDIRITEAHGATAFVRTSDGDISVENLAAEDSQLQSSDGTIVAKGVDGAVKAQTSSGDIRVTFDSSVPATLRTSDGDIVIYAMAGHAAELDIRGEEVRLASGFEFNGELKKKTAEGRINGGGPVLQAIASDGSVVFREN